MSGSLCLFLTRQLRKGIKLSIEKPGLKKDPFVIFCMQLYIQRTMYLDAAML